MRIAAWNHPHSADLLVYFAGCSEVSWVQATCELASVPEEDIFVDDDPVVESATVKFTNGVIGTISSRSGLNTRLSGTQGMLTVLGDGRRIEICAAANRSSPYHLESEIIDAEACPSATQRAFQELAEAVGSGAPLSIEPDEIIAGQRILFAIVVSSIRDGRRIRPSEVDPRLTVAGRIGDLYA